MNIAVPIVIGLFLRRFWLAGGRRRGGGRIYLSQSDYFNGFLGRAFSNRREWGRCRQRRRCLAPHPAAQGIGPDDSTFIDTVIIQAASAMLILTGGNGTPTCHREGIQLYTQKAPVPSVPPGAEFATLVVTSGLPSVPSLPFITPKTIPFFLRLNNPSDLGVCESAPATVIGALPASLMWQPVDNHNESHGYYYLDRHTLFSWSKYCQHFIYQRELGVRPVRSVVQRRISVCAFFSSRRGMMLRVATIQIIDQSHLSA